MTLSENNRKYKVIIIGAGISGIAAATRLYKKGITDILLLEAQDKIGGRIQTVKFGKDKTVELGAQWVHGEKGNVVYELASERSLLEYDDPNFSTALFINSSSGLVDEELGDKIYDVIFNLQDEDPKALKMKYGDFLRSCFIEELKSEKLEIEDELKESFISWCEQEINAIDGSDSWNDTSITTYSRYEKCEGCSTVAWKSGGYQKLFEILMEGIGDEINKKILLNHEVVRINWNSEPVTIDCANGITMETDTLIVTASLGFLKENYKTLFNPELPDSKISAIRGLGYGTVDKLFMEFPEKWWTSETQGFSLLWNQKDKEQMKNEGRGWLCDVFGFYEVAGVENVLLGWISGPSARKMESKTDDEVKDELMWLLRKFAGTMYDVVEPNFFLRSRWYSNKYTRGSYSYRSVLTDELETSAEILAEPLVNESGNSNLLFAGEATHYRYHSTVHGALESGWREADRIIKKCINS